MLQKFIGMLQKFIGCMHSNVLTQPIATTLSNCNRANSQVELEEYLERQATDVAPEPVDPVAARIRSRNEKRVKEALEEGLDYASRRQGKTLKEFKAWATEQGFVYATACKYMKLYETFKHFVLEQIGWVDINLLFKLCQPRYKELLEQMRSLPLWTNVKVEELIDRFRAAKKAQKPKPATEEPGTGWRQLPGGGRGLQLPLVHEDWLSTLIERVRSLRNQTLTQLVKDMTLFFVEWGEVPGITLRDLKIPVLPRSDRKTFGYIR